MFGIIPPQKGTSAGATKGADGRDIELRSTGQTIQWRYKGFRQWFDLIALAELRGKDGPKGPAGKPGEKGDIGSIGARGADGRNGLMGPTGPKGDVGPRGFVGDRGLPGKDGKDGEKGVDGREIELQTSKTHIQWRYVGEPKWKNLIALSELKGEKGERGAAGVQGERGLRGPQGWGGPAGPQGPQGPPGSGGVESVVAGTNVTVDDTDPANPIVSATGGGAASQYITEGVNGILVVRMQGPTTIWDMSIDDLGQWVSTEVTSALSGSPIGLLLSLTYP